jgi:hypothetical protein
VVTLLSREMLHAEPGKQTVLDRLLDVLVVLGLRSVQSEDGVITSVYFIGNPDKLTSVGHPVFIE